MSPELKLPDVSYCRTEHHFGDYWVCLGKGYICSDYCPYVLKFGNNHYCKHPKRYDFSQYAVRGQLQ
jgi:hypothetical protein